MIKQWKIVSEWAKLRNNNNQFISSAIMVYESEDENGKKQFIKECKEYIKGVKSGKIIPSVPKIPIRVFKERDIKRLN